MAKMSLSITLVVLIFQQLQSIHGIYKGTDGDFSQYPYVVAIINGNRLCGGTLLDATHVLTGANCVDSDDLAQIKVYANNLDRTKGEEIEVKSIKAHPKYDLQRIFDDIAVITLNSPANVTQFVKLPSGDDSDLRIGTECEIMGWGQTQYRSLPSDTLRIGNRIPIRDVEKCKTTSYEFDPYWFYCAGTPKNAPEICTGDLGGPLVCEGTEVGILSLSLGSRCQGKQGMLIAIKVSKYIDFINEAIHENKTSVYTFCNKTTHF